MPSLSRRSFLAASAMLAARPAFAPKQKRAGDDADVIIVGAGAAGIAAARRLTAEKLKVLVFEAQDRVGGGCATDSKTFGVPFGLGAHWIHNPDSTRCLRRRPRRPSIPRRAGRACASGRVRRAMRSSNCSSPRKCVRNASRRSRRPKCLRPACCRRIWACGARLWSFCLAHWRSAKTSTRSPPSILLARPNAPAMPLISKATACCSRGLRAD
jgi:putative NAD(P)-binding protein